jgi:hypothetical protein
VKNRRVIVLNGFRRGGTSIVWNLLQSHPSICGAGRETGEILFEQVFRRAPALARTVLASEAMVRSPLGFLLGTIVDRALHARKLANQGRTDTYHGAPCTAEDLESAALCLKSVDDDIPLTGFLARVYPEAAFIGLMRNGYALCNGWMRRGMSAWTAGQTYRRIGEAMIDHQRRLPRYRIIRFEDVLRDPFGMAEILFAFVQVDPVTLDKLRLKSKRVIAEDRSHAVRFGAEGRKYWVDRTQIRDILDPSIDDKQAASLTRRDRLAFAKHAGPILERFGYV